MGWIMKRRTGFFVRWATNLCLVLVLVLAAVSSTLPAVAQEHAVSIGDGSVSKVNIRPDSTATVSTDVPFSDLIVGSAKIVDVVPLTDRSLFVRGKAQGATTISLYDSSKTLLGVLDIRVRVSAAEVSRAIRAAAPRSRVRVVNVRDTLRLSGVVANAGDLAKVVDVARQYSSKPILNQIRVAAAQQVMLEVRILEAQRTVGRDLGIGWTGSGKTFIGSGSGRIGIAVDDDNKAVFSLGDGSGSASGARPFGQLIAKVLQWSGVRIDLVINALEGKGLVRRLAQPNLVAISGQTASFHAGGEVPISRTVQSGGTVSTDTEYRPYGVRLTFTPIVLDNGLINMVIEPEISEIDSSVNVNGNPGFISRRARTTVELRNGQSFALAGLLRTINARNIEQMPWLGNLPVLGALFKSTSFQKQESDLVIIVTPRIVRPSNPGEKLATPLDDTRPSDDVELFALGILEVDKRMKKAYRDGKGVEGPYGHIIDLDFKEAGLVKKK